jgi:asparagine synthase (glutamine-hydrolysing)
MGYLVGAIHKNGTDASETLLKMFIDTPDNKNNEYGIAIHSNIEFFKNRPQFTSLQSDQMIGFKSNVLGAYSQPLNYGKKSLAIEGHIWDIEEPESLFLANLVERNQEKNVKKIISDHTGNFSFLILDKSGITCGRDVIGATPLYYGEDKEVIVISSNKKMIWRNGLSPISIQPGTITQIYNNKVKTNLIRKIKNPLQSNESEIRIIENIEKIVKNAAKIMTKGITKATIGFSGGIDSTIIAYFLKELGIDINLICVGVDNPKEFNNAIESAENLGLDLTLQSYTEKQVEETLDYVLYSIEESNPMKIGVAMPLYWVSEIAYERGFNDVFTGNGSDELFGGYKKYQLEYKNSHSTVRKNMYQDVINSWSTNLERDTMTCNDNSIRLRLPFTEINLIQYGLKTPLIHKFKKTGPRKIILRKLAKKLGIPEKISYRPKKAAQYSTGVNKTIKKIAKKHDLSIQKYLQSRFKNIFNVTIDEE